jgi:hypothetical protein
MATSLERAPELSPGVDSRSPISEFFIRWRAALPHPRWMTSAIPF